MRLLLDTHALIWFFGGDERLPVRVRAAIEDADATILVSAVSAMEVTTKHRLGKLPQAGRLALGFGEVIEQYGFVELPISLAHAEAAGRLQIPHKDPFDRILIAQALLEGVSLASNERGFDAFGVTRLW